MAHLRNLKIRNRILVLIHSSQTISELICAYKVILILEQYQLISRLDTIINCTHQIVGVAHAAKKGFCSAVVANETHTSRTHKQTQSQIKELKSEVRTATYRI
jgi:hypothetical protein